MKKFIFLFFITSFSLFAFNSNIQASYAIGIFDEKGKGENIQHKRVTNNDYNGVCYSKIVIFGDFSNSKIEIHIGDSLGYYENSKTIYSKQKIKIGEELTFKHFNVQKGYFQVKINNKVYDTKVFVK